MSNRKFSPALATSTRSLIPLEAICIASPCHADWGAMSGDERARFCGSCHKNVYNLSEMTRAEAEALILEKEGKLCVRYYQRADGTVLTQDCPIGLLQVDARIKGRFAVAAFVSSVCILFGALMAGTVGVPASTAVAGGIAVAPPTSSTNGPVLMGDISPLPSPSPTSTPAPTPPRPIMGLIALPQKATPAKNSSQKPTHAKSKSPAKNAVRAAK